MRRNQRWAGKTEDLWSWGRPAGYGGPWFDDLVAAGEPSDPYLIAGFTHHCLQLCHDQEGQVTVDVECDATGTGRWCRAVSREVPPEGLVHTFPVGFQAHWLHLIARRDARCTAQLRSQ